MKTRIAFICALYMLGLYSPAFACESGKTETITNTKQPRNTPATT